MLKWWTTVEDFQVADRSSKSCKSFYSCHPLASKSRRLVILFCLPKSYIVISCGLRARARKHGGKTCTCACILVTKISRGMVRGQVFFFCHSSCYQMFCKFLVKLKALLEPFSYNKLFCSKVPVILRVWLVFNMRGTLSPVYTAQTDRVVFTRHFSKLTRVEPGLAVFTRQKLTWISSYRVNRALVILCKLR